MKVEKIGPDLYKLYIGNKTCTKPRSCRECPLFGKLKIEPDYSQYKNFIIVGEGPGRDERFKMKPFTGSSGTLLRAVLEDTKALEFGPGFTNLLLCEGSGDLSDEAFDNATHICADRLEEEIAEKKPKLVVPAGNLPKQFFLASERKLIRAIAGTLYKNSDTGLAYDILPILHPAAVLYHAKDYEFFWDLVNEVYLYFAEKDIDFGYKMGSLEAIKELWQSDRLTVDTETTSFSPFDTGEFEERNKTFNLGQVLCLSICGNRKYSYVFTDKQIRDFKPQLKELLEAKGVTCHNAQFDVPFLKSIGINTEIKEDTMLLHYAMEEGQRHPLKRLSRRYLGLEDWSVELDEYLPSKEVSYAAVPDDILYKYCGLDTTACHNLYYELDSRAEETDKKIYRELLIPIANMFTDISYKGIRIDMTKLLSLRDEWLTRKHTLWCRLKDFGIKNPASPFQVSKALQVYQVVEFDALTRKAQLEALEKKCQHEGNDAGAELCRTIIDWRSYSKAIDTFLYGVASSVSLIDSRVHPDFKLYGTVTGRITIGSPSLLNYPHTTQLSADLRSIYIPDKGYVWCHRDQKQFELRTYTALRNDAIMAKIFAEDRDPHGEIGATVYGSKEAYEEENKREMGSIRTAIKAVVFGCMYGRGTESISDQYDIPISQAEVYKKAVESMFGGLSAYRKDIEKALNEEQVLVNPLGRSRRFPLITTDNYHECLLQAYNYPIQSTASDLNLLGMHKMWKDIGGVLPFFPVHDAIEYQVLESELDEKEEIIDELLSSIPKMILGVKDINFRTDAGYGSDWGEATK